MPRNDLKHVPIDLLVPNDWNPQDQDEATFQRLVDEIVENGFMDPCEVVPLEDGRYRIIGGEHRWMAAKAAQKGLEEAGKPDAAKELDELPCIILTGDRWKDEDLQKFVTIRLNVIRGKLDPEKFLKLYEELADKYGAESLQTLMGYTDAKGFQKLVDGVRKGMQKALPKDLQDEFEDRAKDAKTAEDLQRIIQMLFAKYGETVDQSFMIFTYGKQEHIYVQMNKDMRKAMDKVVVFCKMTCQDINDFMVPITQAYMKAALEALEKGEKAPSA
jgi:ParB-like chromosome segregation protein Spo0J